MTDDDIGGAGGKERGENDSLVGDNDKAEKKE